MTLRPGLERRHPAQRMTPTTWAGPPFAGHLDVIFSTRESAPMDGVLATFARECPERTIAFGVSIRCGTASPSAAAR